MQRTEQAPPFGYTKEMNHILDPGPSQTKQAVGNV